METKRTFKLFMETVDKNIKKGGIFMFTCFDVTRVKNLLKDTVINEEYSFNVKDKKPLSITKLYESIDTPFGNEIDVYVETIGKHPEYLVDIEYLNDYLENSGYRMLENISFEEMFNKSDRLSSGERDFVRLYHKVVYSKI